MRNQKCKMQLYYIKKRKLNNQNSLENNKKIDIIKFKCKKNKKKK